MLRLHFDADVGQATDCADRLTCASARTRLGTFRVVAARAADGDAVVRVEFPDCGDPLSASPSDEGAAAVAARWIVGHLDGVPDDSVVVRDVHVRYHAASSFERAVWTALAAVPSGTTVTYGALAATIGRPGAARAVGGACARNPVPLLVPCHRVVASAGPGGYAGGVALKRRLLAIEER